MTTLAFNDRYQKTTPSSSTDPQSVDFEIFSTADLDVYVNGVLTTDFTISATFTDGVSSNAVVTIITPVTSSPTVEIVGARDPRRDQFLVAAGAQLVAAMNSDLARRTAEIMELFRDTGRAVKAPFGENLSKALPKAADRANKYLFFDGAGDPGATGDAPPATRQDFDTRTAASSATIDPAINLIVTGGYATFGDGGGATHKRGSEPSHALKVSSNGGTVWWELVPAPEGINVRQAGAKGDNSTNDATALNNALAAGALNSSVIQPQGIYLAGSLITGTDNPARLIGAGWQRDASGALIGTVLKANATGVSNLLLIQSTTPGSGDTTDQSSVIIRDFALIHRGSGTGLKIDNIIRSRLQNLWIECQDEGAIGLEYDNFGFFSVLDQCVINDFTATGVLIDGSGSQHAIRNCHIASTNASAVAAIEVRRFDFLIDGGQYNVNLSGNTGIGILVNNTNGGASKTGGRIVNTICETDIAVKITGTTQPFTNVIIERPFWNLASITKGVIFDRASRCVLINPHVRSPTSGTLAEWTANSADCGVICDADAARSTWIVNASATRPWVHVTGRLTITARDLIATNANLTITCEDVETVGRCIHNGVDWDVQFESVLDDIVVAVTPPKQIGIVQIIGNGGVGEHILARYTAVGMEALVEGTKGTVILTDGVLTNAGNVDGDITIRKDSSSGDIYISNQAGGTRKFLITFRDSVPD